MYKVNKNTLSWCRTEWQSACRYSTKVSSSIREQDCFGSQHTHRPCSTCDPHTIRQIGEDAREENEKNEKTSKWDYLAGEVRFHHLCILTGEHGASQAENHTHGRQQHEQWHLHKTHLFLIPSLNTTKSTKVFLMHESQTYHQGEGSPPRYHSYYSRSHDLQQCADNCDIVSF